MKKNVLPLLIMVALASSAAAATPDLEIRPFKSTVQVEEDILDRLTKVVPEVASPSPSLSVDLGQSSLAFARMEFPTWPVSLQLDILLGPSVSVNGWVENFLSRVTGKLIVHGDEETVWSIKVANFASFTPVALYDPETGLISIRVPVALTQENSSRAIHTNLVASFLVQDDVLVNQQIGLTLADFMEPYFADAISLEELLPKKMRALARRAEAEQQQEKFLGCCQDSNDRCVLSEVRCHLADCGPYCDYCTRFLFPCSCPNTCYF